MWPHDLRPTVPDALHAGWSAQVPGVNFPCRPDLALTQTGCSAAALLLHGLYKITGISLPGRIPGAAANTISVRTAPSGLHTDMLEALPLPTLIPEKNMVHPSSKHCHFLVKGTDFKRRP